MSFNEDYAYGGDLTGAVTASLVGLSWDVTQLISRDAKVRAAKAGAASVDLDIAWQEWQTAEAARTAVYDLASQEAQLELRARSPDNWRRRMFRSFVPRSSSTTRLCWI